MTRGATSQDPFEPVLLTLPSLAPSLALEVVPHGLIVNRLFVQADGKTHDLVVGPETPLDHLKKKYTNTIIGRYSNRLPVGTFEVERNGIKGKVSPVANEKPTVSLHGGTRGYDSVTWLPLDPSSSTLFTPSEVETIKSDIATSTLWTYTSNDGDMGFEGTLYMEVLMGLLDAPKPTSSGPEFQLGSVVIVYRAKLLEEQKITPVNLTQHWGFNLTASLKDGPDSLSVKGHKMTSKADNYLALDSSALSSGKLVPVEGTFHDLTKGKVLGDEWPDFAPGITGFDWFYVFPPTTPATPLRISGTDLKPSANFLKGIVSGKLSDEETKVDLSAEKSGLRLVFGSNQSGVQFYTNNFATTDGVRKKIHGGSGLVGEGQGYGPGSAAFLEFHEPLAAFLHPETVRDGFDTLITSGEVYNNYVRLDVWYTPTASGRDAE